MVNIAPIEFDDAPAPSPSPVAAAQWLDALPAMLMLVLWLVWIESSGGYFATVWYPSALAALSLLAATMVIHRRVLPEGMVARRALLLAGALVALNYLSLLWADSPASALNAADQLLLYLLGGWIFALLPWSPRMLCAALLVWSLGVTATCAIGLIQALDSRQLASFFVEYRYAAPLMYSNATAALAVMGMWPALVLSSRLELSPWLRAAALAAASFCLEFSFLPQTRGVLLGLAVSTPLVLLFAARRPWLLARMAILGVGMAFSLPQTLAVGRAVNAGRLVGPALSSAATTMLITTLVVLVLGALLGMAETRLCRPSSEIPRLPLTRGRVLAVAALVLVVLVAGGVVSYPRLSRALDQSSRVDQSVGSTRLFSGSPEERVDYARVALKLFSGAPVLGVGAGNFGRHYDAQRRFAKHSQYTHDITLRVLSETGLVGLLLFLGLIVALALCLLSAWSAGGLGRACAVATLGLCAYFLAHASVDWMDQFPALAVPVFAFALAAGRLSDGRRAAASASPRPLWPGDASRRRPKHARAPRIPYPLALAGGGVVLLAAVVALGGPYLSMLAVQRADSIYSAHPSAAYSDLRLARVLNPVSPDPLITRGLIAEQFEQNGRAQAAFSDALGVQRDWYPLFELSLLDAQQGRFAVARAELAAAERLDTHDPALAQVASLEARGRRLDPVQANQLLQGGAENSVFAPEKIR